MSTRIRWTTVVILALAVISERSAPISAQIAAQTPPCPRITWRIRAACGHVSRHSASAGASWFDLRTRRR